MQVILENSAIHLKLTAVTYMCDTQFNVFK